MVRTRKYLRVLCVGMLSTAGMAPAAAGADMFDGNWHFSATPYLWLPYIDGTVNYSVGRGGSISAQVDLGPFCA